MDATRRQEGYPQPNKPASGKDGMNFAQLIHAKTKKAVCSALKKANHGRKLCNCHKVIAILTLTTEVLG